MLFRRSTAVTLATAAMTLGISAPALAVPALDADTGSAAPPVLVMSGAPSVSDEGGLDTLAVVLLATGALAAGAAAGFGGAKVATGRKALHPS